MLLDAAMGTSLLAQGLSGRAPARNLSHPEQVRGVHLRHVAAGAEMVLTNTFAGASAEEAAAAVKLARESGARYVAGSLWAGLRGSSGASRAAWRRRLHLAGGRHQHGPGGQRTGGGAAGNEAAGRGDGGDAQRAPAAVPRNAGATAAGYNCSPWPVDARGADVVKLAAEGLAPEEWARRQPQARMRGGCCGTDERYLAALRDTPR